MKPLHEELKELREEQQITLKEIARQTRIRLDFLERIEEGDYTVSPMPFVRAFLREYAQVLEVDPAKAMAKLDGKLDTILEPHVRHEPELQPSAEQTPVPESETATDDDAPVDESGSDSAGTTPEETTPENNDPESEQDVQQSLFDDNGATEDDTEATEEESADDDTEADEDDSAEEAMTETSPESGEEPADEPEPADEVVEDKTPTPEPVQAAEQSEKSVEPTVVKHDSALEIDLDDNGKELPSVRRPLELETEKSFGNVIFAAIVVILLIIAGVLIYMNRAAIF